MKIIFEFSDKSRPTGDSFKTAAGRNSFNLSQKKIFYKCSEAEETGLHVQGAGTDCKKDCRLQIGMI